MLEKIKVLKKVEILESGWIQIQWAHRIMEDGKMLAETYERTTRHIKDDLKDLEDKIKNLSSLKDLYPDKPIETGAIHG
jgi:hypothetical protein